MFWILLSALTHMPAQTCKSLSRAISVGTCLLGLPLCILLASTATAATTSTRVESWLTHDALGVVSFTDMLPERYCKSFLEQNQGRHLRCGVVKYPGDFSAVVLDEPDREVVEPTNAAKCDREFSNKIQQMQQAFFAIPFSEAEKRHALEGQLRKFALENEAQLIALIGTENCQMVRQSTASLLRFTNLCADNAKEVLGLLLDPDVIVRNGVGQCVSKSVIRMQPADRIRAVDLSFELASLPNHSDRNKALGIIHNAVIADKTVASYVREAYEPRLRDISSRSFLPNVGGLASTILKLLAVPSSK